MAYTPALVREDPGAVLREVAGTAADGLLDVPESDLNAEAAMRKLTGIAESGQA